MLDCEHSLVVFNCLRLLYGILVQGLFVAVVTHLSHVYLVRSWEGVIVDYVVLKFRIVYEVDVSL